MKRILATLLAAVMLLSLCACGGKQEEETVGATIDFDPPEIEIDMPETTAPETTAPETEKTETGSNVIDFNPIGGSFELPKIEPVTIQPNIIEFKPIDIKLSMDFPKIEVQDFNATQFVEDSALNFDADDLEALGKMDAAQLAQIAQKRAGLLADLKLAFQSVGLTVQINETTGEIALDAAVLFDVNESDLSDQGKQLLKQFVDAYTYVVFNDKYEGFVEKIMIEGHTDTDGGYDYNLKLSQKRADAVLAYALSEDCGMDAQELKQFKASAEAKGYSYDRPVLNAAGQVDKTASRRVTFCFIINAQ